jgi:hypothetical protein
MLKRTTNHAEPHHKVKVNRAQNANQNSKQGLNHKLKNVTSPQKNFSCTHTNPLQPTASSSQHAQSSRLATLMVPFSNIERHAKTAKTEPETPYRIPNSAQNAN